MSTTSHDVDRVITADDHARHDALDHDIHHRRVVHVRPGHNVDNLAADIRDAHDRQLAAVHATRTHDYLHANPGPANERALDAHHAIHGCVYAD